MVKVKITGVVINPPFSLGYSPGEEGLVTEEMAKKLAAAGLCIIRIDLPQKAVKPESEKR